MTGIWPGLTQCTVNLGFDIDAQSNWIGRDPAFRNRAGYDDRRRLRPESRRAEDTQPDG